MRHGDAVIARWGRHDVDAIVETTFAVGDAIFVTVWVGDTTVTFPVERVRCRQP